MSFPCPLINLDERRVEAMDLFVRQISYAHETEQHYYPMWFVDFVTRRQTTIAGSAGAGSDRRETSLVPRIRCTVQLALSDLGALFPIRSLVAM